MVLTSLFAITQSRNIASMETLAVEHSLLEHDQWQSDVLNAALAFRTAQPRTASFELSGIEVSLRDVGGLVDLNTATPELLQRLAQGLGITEMQMASFRTWRRMPHRTLSQNDFARVTQLSHEQFTLLDRLTTVFSGRSGISIDNTSEELVTVLGHTHGSLPTNMQSEPTGTTFVVYALGGHNSTLVAIGTIRLSANMANGVIIERN